MKKSFSIFVALVLVTALAWALSTLAAARGALAATLAFFALCTLPLAFRRPSRSLGMANELARNIQDVSLNPAAFALPAAASTSTTSAVIDLGTDTFKPETVELDLAIPALSTTIVPDTRTVTAIIETSTTSVFTAVDTTIFSKTLTGAGGAGVGAQTGLRCRLPSNCARYVRGKVTFNASTTDGSAVSATLTIRF